METKGQEVTERDLVTDAVVTLRRLNVPIELMEQIGVPVARVIRNLNALLDAWARNAAKEAEQAAAEEPIAAEEAGGDAD